MKKEKVLVTGGLGFIGSHLCDELCKKYEVIALDNLSNNKVKEASDKLFQANILDKLLLTMASKNVKYIFHLAAISSVPYSTRHLEETNEINIQGTINVLEASKINKVKKVIFASSSAVYNPISPYAISKLCGEHYCNYFGKSIILRLFNVYGNRQGGNVVKCFSDRTTDGKPLIIYGDGGQIRDFIHIDDVVRAFIYFAENVKSGTYDIGTGIGTSIKELAKMFSSKIKCYPARKGDIIYSRAMVSPALDVGFKTEVGLEEGLTRI